MLDLEAIAPLLAVAEGEDDELAVLALEALANLPLDPLATEAVRRVLGPKTDRWEDGPDAALRPRTIALAIAFRLAWGGAFRQPTSPFERRDTARRLITAAAEHASGDRRAGSLRELLRLADRLGPREPLGSAAIEAALRGELRTTMSGGWPSPDHQLIGDPPEGSSGGPGGFSRPVPGGDSVSTAEAPGAPVDELDTMTDPELTREPAGSRPSSWNSELDLTVDDGEPASSAPEPSEGVAVGEGPLQAAEPELLSGEAAPGEAAPARRRWPRLDVPPAVVAEVAFELTVGLAANPSPSSVTSGPIELPAGDVEVEVTVMAHGFRIEGRPEVLLRVTEADPFPSRTLRLTAIAAHDLVAERRVFAVFSVVDYSLRAADTDILGVDTVGTAETVRHDTVRAVAERVVRVVERAEDLPAPGAEPPPEAGVDLSLPPPGTEADLTLVLSLGNDAAGEYLEWSLRSSVLPLPSAPASPDERGGSVGDRPDRFLDTIVRKAGETADPFDLFVWLAGRGRRIAEAMPPFVRAALAEAVRRRAPEPPSVLLLSADPHVPWELAVLDELADDSGASPFLGARVRLGRWPFKKPPPQQDPPRSVAVRRVAAVSGVYDGVPGWRRLPHAENEARQVVERWGPGEELPPEFDEVIDCLAGDPAAELLHFALHGRFETDATRSGLVLLGPHPTTAGEVVEKFLQGDHVRDGRLRGPFVFLNACQVGAGERLLGDYGGMAADFLAAGASAVVAPLWSVDDQAAHAFALAFYEQTLDGDRLPPAEVLRRHRAAITRERARAESDGSGLLSVLAYQLFGHPAYRLTRAAAPGSDGPGAAASQEP